MTPSLADRHLIPELMDDPELDPDEHRRALRGLARLNRVGGALRILWPPIAEVARRLERPIRVLDVACGGGDITVYLARRARQRGLSVEVHGCDISDTALEHARAHADAARVPARFFRADVLGGGLPEGYDVILTSQFLHHLEEEAVTRLLAAMAAGTRDSVLVSDLLRGRRSLLVTTAASHLLTRSAIVRFDGPQSIRAAFTLAEIEELVAGAGLEGASLQRRWPVHFLLHWRRP